MIWKKWEFKCEKSNKKTIIITSICVSTFSFIGLIILNNFNPSFFEDLDFKIPFFLLDFIISFLFFFGIGGILSLQLCIKNKDERVISQLIDKGNLIEKINISGDYFKPNIEKKTIAKKVLNFTFKVFLWVELVFLLVLLVFSIITGNEMIDIFIRLQITILISFLIGYLIVYIITLSFVKYNRYYIKDNKLIIYYNYFSFWTIKNEIALSDIESVSKTLLRKRELPFPPHNKKNNIMIKINFIKEIEIVHYKDSGTIKNLFKISKFRKLFLTIHKNEADQFIGGLAK